MNDKPKVYRPANSNVKITEFPDGGKQYQKTTQTKTGMKRVIYDQPPKKK
jgi:hypothetical protein